MKIKLILIAAALIVVGICALAAWSDNPADEGAIKRAKANAIMCQTYGDNWLELYYAGIRNHAPNRSMIATYKSAIGYHRPK
ncbi:MAG TPA: hypothetical protein VNX46_06905 [Candidatus Acidoferrum sp.]|nr:hypothetical protein [Candidatus Acidoferrum sp.]